MFSKINFFFQRNIRSANSNFIPYQEVENGNGWWFLCDTCRHILRNCSLCMFVHAVFPYKCIRFEFDVAEFNDQFYHFHYATPEMFKGTFNNYSVLKLHFSDAQRNSIPSCEITVARLTICLYICPSVTKFSQD